MNTIDVKPSAALPKQLLKHDLFQDNDGYKLKDDFNNIYLAEHYYPTPQEEKPEFIPRVYPPMKTG